MKFAVISHVYFNKRCAGPAPPTIKVNEEQYPNSIVDTGTTGNGENSEERVTKPIRGINSAVANHEVVPIKSSRWNKALAKVLKFILPKNEGRLEYKGNGQWRFNAF
ncbi:hypothetical protein JG688_00010085 [Phytophthora aleatoria]|uniref:Uncharacterized protein n=1 Tax=Phytophthora aleatoria TaxID=2496075 RepID=A0A8J5ISB0_9STRA|nr:hypothetical protein JG688_00010085 [Phytophthora aleatoria]